MTSYAQAPTRPALAALLLLSMPSSGCSVSGFAADQAGQIASESTPHMRGFWDYEIAGHGNAAGIMQLESLYALSPDNEDLALTLAASCVGFAFGWVEVEAEAAEDRGDYRASARQRHRAELLYAHARDVALRAMRTRDDGIDAALRQKPPALRAYLRAHYDSPEQDTAPVFWLAAAWGARLSMSEDMSLAIDLPTIVTLVEHVLELDPGFEDGAALVFLGGFHAQYPAQMGGSPEKGKAFFERALALTGRRAHQVHLNYARLYATTVDDEALFRSLLDEILEAPDQGRDVRLANKIARIRAEALVRKADTLF